MATTGADRTATLRLAIRLEVATIAWNLVEGVVALIAALAAGSVALLGVGIDSFIESLFAGVLVWRLQAEYGQQYPDTRIAQLDDVMLHLARSKREAARVLGSRALEADAFQTTPCWWPSLIVLAGIVLNALFGWW